MNNPRKIVFIIGILCIFGNYVAVLETFRVEIVKPMYVFFTFRHLLLVRHEQLGVLHWKLYMGN